MASLAWVLGALVGCGGSAGAPDADAAVDADHGEALGPALYPADRILSPLTPELVAHLREVHATLQAGAGADAVFAKIGDSHTVTTSYLGCFASSTAVDLAGRDLAATVAHFGAGDAAGTTPYQRVSAAATIGWAAFQALAGTPSPIEQELAAIHPAFATVMFGTNDIGYDRIDRYGQNLVAITDLLLARGIIPVLSTIPPRDDDAAAQTWVPRYNAIVRGVAQTRGVPLIDLHLALGPLAAHGLGPDHLHLETFPGGACKLTTAGLAHGNNTRNLATLETLDRLRRTILAAEPAPDATAAHLRGAGTSAQPFLVEQLPFADRRDTRTFGASEVASYPTCSPAAEGGNEVYYRLEVSGPTQLHAYVIDLDADVDLHVLRGAPTPDACFARGDTTVDTALTPGTYYVVVDTFVSAGTPKAGDYTVVITTD